MIHAFIPGTPVPQGSASEDKRFQPWELVAEYWRRAAEFYPFESEEVESGRLATLRRFAALPHYDKEPA